MRAWQQAALDDYLSRDPRDYLAVATPARARRRSGFAAQPTLHRARCENRRTLVVLDEVHHAGRPSALVSSIDA